MHVVKETSKEVTYQFNFIENSFLIWMNSTPKIQAGILINC